AARQAVLGLCRASAERLVAEDAPPHRLGHLIFSGGFPAACCGSQRFESLSWRKLLRCRPVDARTRLFVIAVRNGQAALFKIRLTRLDSRILFAVVDTPASGDKH